MHPLPQQSPRVVDLVADELDFHFLVHVHLFGVDETGHEHVGLLDVHVIGTCGPGNAQLFEVVAKPARFLLETQVSHLFRRHVNCAAAD